VGLVVVVVVDRSDAPDDLTISLGEEEVNPGVLVEGVFLGVELLPLVDQQRRNPVRILAVFLEGIRDEPLEVGSGGDTPSTSGASLLEVQTASRSTGMLRLAHNLLLIFAPLNLYLCIDNVNSEDEK